MKRYHPRSAPWLTLGIGTHPKTHQAKQPKNQRVYKHDTETPKSTNNDTTEFVASNKRSAIENTEAIEPDPKRIGIEARALMMRSLDNDSKQVAYNGFVIRLEHGDIG